MSSFIDKITPLIDTDNTRENNIPLDVKIPITRENAEEIFGDNNKDIELEYAIEYLQKSN